MLVDLRRLLDAMPLDEDRAGYREGVVVDNVLLKSTLSTRKESFSRLGQLYGLDRQLTLFRALRDLWAVEGEAQPLLAVLCALARDPGFRATADVVMSAAKGEAVSWEVLGVAVAERYPGRFNTTTLTALAQHTWSSWAQSGHLSQRRPRLRQSVAPRATAVAYALLLGHLAGARGEGLFRTVWARLLDATEPVLREQAQLAARQGWLEYRASGGVTELTFRQLLRPVDKTASLRASA